MEVRNSNIEVNAVLATTVWTMRPGLIYRCGKKTPEPDGDGQEGCVVDQIVQLRKP